MSGSRSHSRPAAGTGPGRARHRRSRDSAGHWRTPRLGGPDWAPLMDWDMFLLHKAPPRQTGAVCEHGQLLSRVRLCSPVDCGPPGSSIHGIHRQEPWSGRHFLLQGVFLPQGSNPRPLHWQAGSVPTELPGKPEQWLSSHQVDRQHPDEADRPAESNAGAKGTQWRRDSNPAPAFHSQRSFVKPGSEPTASLACSKARGMETAGNLHH